MIVHLGWIGGEPPPRFFEAVEEARARATGCEVLVHRDERDVPSEWREKMDSMPLRPVTRSDVLRHAVLEKYGGLWLDADVRLLSNPVEWAGAWSRYSAIRFANRVRLVGSDVIFAPKDWPRWSRVRAYIDDVLSTAVASRSIAVLALASDMILRLASIYPSDFAIFDPGVRFPLDPRTFTSAALVARGFDPSSTPVRSTPNPRPRVLPTRGPGTELSELLRRWFGISAGAGCSCRATARKMDERGPDWCESEAGSNEILSAMRREYDKRRAAGKLLLPWSDVGARQLVRIACRRARSRR